MIISHLTSLIHMLALVCLQKFYMSDVSEEPLADPTTVSSCGGRGGGDGICGNSSSTS